MSKRKRSNAQGIKYNPDKILNSDKFTPEEQKKLDLQLVNLLILAHTAQSKPDNPQASIDFLSSYCVYLKEYGDKRSPITVSTLKHYKKLLHKPKKQQHKEIIVTGGVVAETFIELTRQIITPHGEIVMNEIMSKITVPANTDE